MKVFPKLMLAFFLMLSSFLVNAQTRVITGTVRDEEGLPIQGVSVSVKNHTGGTVTNASGQFSLNALPGATLVFSSINYLPFTLRVDEKTQYTLGLKRKTGTLSDVIVVGYGTQKRATVTGAVSVISKDVLENRPVTNSVAALQGAAPGLIITRSSGEPGQEGYNINVRGLSSLNGTNTALVVIDGVAGGDLTLINPYDIESISVLKDAAAAAIYGAQASGGVILVTTKKGTSGRMRVEYTGLYTVNTRYNVPKLLASWQAAEMVDQAYINAGNGAPYSAAQIRVMKSDTSFLPAGTNLNTNPITIPAPGTYTSYTYYHALDANAFLRQDTYSQNHNVSASGGNDRTQYFLGLGYYTQNGVLAIGPDAYQRYNARFNINMKMSRILSLESRIGYTFGRTVAPNAVLNGDNGMLYDIYSRASTGVQTGTIYLPNDSTHTKIANASGGDIYGVLKYGGYNSTNQHTLTGAFTLKADSLAKGLTLRLVYNPGLQQTDIDVFAKNVTEWSTLTTPVTVVTTGGGASTTSPNYLSKTRATQYTHDIQALGDYNWQLGNDHNFHVLGGFEYQYYNYNSDNVKATNLVSTTTPSLNFVSASSVVTANDNVQTNDWVSFFGRLDYNYKSKYIFEFNLRDDGSSKLAPGYRYQLFPSVSGGWRISQEDWFARSAPFVNELKIRASYGSLGNAQLGALNTNNYNYIATLSQGASTVFNNVNNYSYYQSALPSLGQGWETIKTTDVGTDIALLKSRLNFTFDYFKRDNDNMLITVNYPATLGVSPSTTNSASMTTHGWELFLGWTDHIGRGFSYWINGNLSDNTNKLTKYEGTTVVNSGLNSTIVGQPINSIYGYIDQGYFTTPQEVASSPFQYAKTGVGDIKYKNLDGNAHVNSAGQAVINGGNNTVADHGDLAYLGNTNPRYTFGINLGASFKGFDFSAILQGVGKEKMLIPQRTEVPFVQTYRTPWAQQLDYWTPTNPNARFPRPYWYGSDAVADAMNAEVSSHWIQNATYLSLKNLQIGYTIPRRITQKARIERARIFFTGQDIWRITGMWYKAFDAENPNNNAWNYPFFRSYAAGVNITF